MWYHSESSNRRASRGHESHDSSCDSRRQLCHSKREIQNGLRLVSETNLTDFNRVRPILPEWARAHSQPTAAHQRQPAEASTTRI